MRIICFILSILLCGCSSIVEITCSDDVVIKDEITQIVQNIVHAGEYHPGMDSGDRFIFLLPLGIPFDLKDASTFRYVEDVIQGDLLAIDRMYVFSKLTDMVLICDSVLHSSPMRLSNMDFEDKDLHRFTSPTYNDSFLFSTVYPLVTDSSAVWTSFEHTLYTHTLAVARKKPRFISVPQLKANGKISIMPICRPWFDEVVVKANIPQGKPAIVEGIIFSQDLNIMKMNKILKVKVYNNQCRKIKIFDNQISASITYPDCIIGYYCRIL
ncbi:hypothetical protein H6A66_15300 [Bacteroides caecigallinarum]|uniref:hypothetical protein n=1 Tax=Bacteroides caecigallinarum TaxID=1411144 RepID=UPI00195AE977|nr:hypothetical protein [Bacteroides caecigallinarum]MBM6866516.1 hypothetical protein [Bacteroides caecigallinarum]